MSDHWLYVCDMCDYTCAANDPLAAMAHTQNAFLHKMELKRQTGKVDPDVALHNDRFAGLNLHEALLASGSVKRYHTHPHVIGGPQTVGEHTYRAAALMLSLWPDWKKDALEALLCHDGAEGAIGDISSTVKRMHPDLGEILDTIEEGVQGRLGMAVESDLDFEGQMWVRICDWLEGAFYAIDQMALGNRGMAMCHNAFVHSLNKLPMTDDVRSRVSAAHHKYLRHPGNGGLKMDLGWISLIERPQDRATLQRNDM